MFTRIGIWFEKWLLQQDIKFYDKMIDHSYERYKYHKREMRFWEQANAMYYEKRRKLGTDCS